MSDILSEAVERIDAEVKEEVWQKNWSNGGSWEQQWENT